MDQVEHNLENRIDEICRLCLQNRTERVSIFDRDNLESFKIQLIIREVCSIKVIPEDSLPKSICGECKDKLYNLYEFVSLCKESDAKLHKGRRMVSKSAQTTDELYEHLDEGEHDTDNCVVGIKREVLDHHENGYEGHSVPVEDHRMMIDDYIARKEQIEEWQNHAILRNQSGTSEVRNKEQVHHLMGHAAMVPQNYWNAQEKDESSQRLEDEMSEEDQLFGKNWPCEEMIHLQSDIYCRKSVFDATHNASQKASHIARRLITGVFKPEAIKRCTLTGQTPRSLGRQRLYDKVDCLHVVARNTIIEYSMYMAKMNGWKNQSIPELKHALSQRLGELKREMKYAELQQT